MDNKQKSALAVAVAASLGGVGVADAATYTATLKSIVSYSANGSSGGIFGAASTTIWSYDDVTGLLSQTGGLFNVRFNIVPATTLFRHSITGLVIGNAAAATGTTYTCTEGNFGPGVGASLCGNYNFGGNSMNESTSTWGPGTAFARTLVGDDMSVGAQQSVAQYDGFTQVSWVGTTLTLSNSACNPLAPGGSGNCSTTFNNLNAGYDWVLDAGPQAGGVPVPAAVWLFGSALGLLGAVRRRTAAKA